MNIGRQLQSTSQNERIKIHFWRHMTSLGVHEFNIVTLHYMVGYNALCYCAPGVVPFVVIVLPCYVFRYSFANIIHEVENHSIFLFYSVTVIQLYFTQQNYFIPSAIETPWWLLISWPTKWVPGHQQLPCRLDCLIPGRNRHFQEQLFKFIIFNA